MRVQRPTIGLAFALLTLVTEPAVASDASSRETALQNGWLFNFRQAKRVAAEADKPLMVVFRCVP